MNYLNLLCYNRNKSLIGKRIKLGHTFRLQLSFFKKNLIFTPQFKGKLDYSHHYS